MEKQFFTLVLITLLAGISMSMVAIYHDPFTANEQIKLLFFGSLFSFLWGAGTLAFFILNIGTNDRWADSFRRGLFLSMVFLMLIFFKRHDIFSWYLGAMIGGIFIAVEIWIYKRLTKKNNTDGWTQ
jgi:hypothetical protein